MEDISKDELGARKEELLKRYHAKKKELAFAGDDIEEGWIEEELEAYRSQIRAYARKMEEMESSEEQIV